MPSSADKRRLIELIGMLCAAFDVEADRPRLMAYELALSDMELGDIETACSRALRESKFMPKPRELRELGGHIDDASRGVLAWNVVLRAIQKVGANSSVDFDDPLINATIRSMGGWTELATQENPELHKWQSQRFTETYKRLAAVGVSLESEIAQPLLGLLEIEGGRHGHGTFSETKRIVSGLPCHPRTKRLVAPDKSNPAELLAGST